jgi:hypothetical protein
LGKPWEKPGKTMGKGKPWENHGKMVETYRKSWENWDLGFIGIFMGYLMMI